VKPFTPSDLPMANGKIYHLDITPEQLAKDIIIVGDPDRVPFIAEQCLVSRECEAYHRGLRTVTGKAKDGLRVSILTSGMGSPSLEVVLGEVMVLNEIDFNTKTRKEKYDTVHIIRVGTSGALQHDTELGVPILTAYAVGMDNSGLFYDAPYPDEGCQVIERAVQSTLDRVVTSPRFKGAIHPYVSRADPTLVDYMVQSAAAQGVKVIKGISVSNSGFFGSQGRDIGRVPLTVPDIDGHLAALGPIHAGLRIENMEMEASLLLHYMGAHGYRAGTICPAIANRREETFLNAYMQHIKDSTLIALETLSRLRKLDH
jgi:uridine phosphorylase